MYTLWFRCIWVREGLCKCQIDSHYDSVKEFRGKAQTSCFLFFHFTSLTTFLRLGTQKTATSCDSYGFLNHVDTTCGSEFISFFLNSRAERNFTQTSLVTQTHAIPIVANCWGASYWQLMNWFIWILPYVPCLLLRKLDKWLICTHFQPI